MNVLPRRSLLFGGAAVAATAATFAVPALTRSGNQDSAGPVVVRWNALSNRWANRPTAAEFGVVFLSTNDPHATAPSDRHLLTGDVWRRHPDAVEV